MNEEMNQQLFYAPIGSDCEPIPFDGEVEIKEFPVTETKHDNELSSFSVSFSARIKRLHLPTGKLPRKIKKRFKTQLSRKIGIPTKELRVLTGGKNRHIKVEFEDECV